jgi:hypothetical protein
MKDFKKGTGVKIAAIGLLIVVIGVIIYLLSTSIIGKVLFFIGGFVVIFGIVLNFILLLSSITENR